MNTYLERTIGKVKASKLTTAQIAKFAGVNSRWLYDVLNGSNKNPGYNQMRQVESFIESHFKTLSENIDKSDDTREQITGNIQGIKKTG